MVQRAAFDEEVVILTTAESVALQPFCIYARGWKDPMGIYAMEAQYVSAKDRKVELRKPNGKIVLVAVLGA